MHLEPCRRERGVDAYLCIDSSAAINDKKKSIHSLAYVRLQQDEGDQVDPYHWRRMGKIESCAYVCTFLPMVRLATGEALKPYNFKWKG